jgi:MYXO-CTERM domain-containing protein
MEASNTMQNPLPSNASKKNPLVKLAAALLALAAPLAFAASCTSGGEEPPLPENVESVEQGISCPCVGLTGDTEVNCPADNSCGEWYCTGLKACSGACGFKKLIGEGDKCETGSGNIGACIQNDAGNGLFCCGCFDKEAGRCYDGTGPQHCGIQGDSCQTCQFDACSVPICKEGQCGTAPANEGGDCNDGNACSTVSACKEGKCVAKQQLNCSDNDPCTNDPCDSSTGCTAHTPVPNSPPKACNDGNLCTGSGNSDVCVDGDCSGAPVVCNDFDPCTDDSCNPNTGCVFTPKASNAPCNDGSACSDNDRCQDHDANALTPLVCKGDGLTCDGGNQCVDPACDEGTNMCPDPPVFKTGGCSTSKCMLNETCSNGVCGGGTPNTCNDGNPCTIDTCNEADGCVNTPIPSGTTVICDDANPCTTNDQCEGDTCGGAEIECTPLDSCHGPGACNEADGTCSDPRLPDDTTCDTTGKCDNGVCIGGTVVTPGEGGAGGEGGAAEPGTAGAPTSAGGETASGGNAGEGSGATSSGGSAGTETDPNKQGGIYARDPGGCSCSVPGAPSERRTQGTLALLLIAGAAFLRRKRAA